MATIRPFAALRPKEEYVEKSFPEEKDDEFSFDSDLSIVKSEPLKEFWD